LSSLKINKKKNTTTEIKEKINIMGMEKWCVVIKRRIRNLSENEYSSTAIPIEAV